MIAITLFDSLYSGARNVVERVVQTTGYQLVTDQEIIREAAELSGMTKERLAAGFPSNIDANYEASDHGEALGWLKRAVAHKLSKRGDLIFYGYSAYLVPFELKHVLRVCLVSAMHERIQVGIREEKCSAKEIRSRIYAGDLAHANWVMAHTDSNDPWDKYLYDLVLPVATLGGGRCACRIVEQLCNAAVQHSDRAGQNLEEFLLATEAQTAISHWGNCISVSAKSKSLTLSFTDYGQTLKEVVRDVSETVVDIEGVKDFHVGFGRAFTAVDVFNRPAQWAFCRNRAVHADSSGTDLFSHGDILREDDCVLAARVEDVLSQEGYPVSVCAEKGSVSLTLTNHAAMLQAVARKLDNVVSRIDGVDSVDVGVIGKYHRTPACLNVRMEAASRVLWDDEREFVPFTSDRLQMTDNLVIAVYDGETAIDADNGCAPEIVLLDADLPGFDVEMALRKVRHNSPGAKVLMLSGREWCKDSDHSRKMNVSAYLQKPVSASVLSNAIRRATADVHCAAP